MTFSLRNFFRPLLALAALGLAVSTLSACAQVVTLESAPDANNPKCASVTVRLPEAIGAFKKRSTDAQATGAWGTPSRILLRCGLPEVKASTLTCVTAGGVDWLVDPSQAPSYRFITFGRNPATEVIVDSKHVSGVTALETLGAAISQSVPVDRLCTEPKS
jgi:hypothetical protein